MKKITCFIVFGILVCGFVSAQNSKPVNVKTMPPVVVKTVPQAGDTNVDPSIKEIRVTFSKPMMTHQQWSVVTVSKETWPKITKGNGYHFLSDKKTFIIPVSLEPGKPYAVWLNRGRYNYFKDEYGTPAVPYLLVFETRK